MYRRVREHSGRWDMIIVGGGATGGGIAIDAATRNYDVLVLEALKERGLLLQNAPHLVHDLGFVVPNYDWWEAPFYGIGLKVYNLLAGKYGFGASRILSKEETLERLPTIRTEGLRGGVIYFDGQFDDSRLLVHMAATACEHGAALLNYAQV